MKTRHFCRLKPGAFALLVVLVYVIVSALWITFSDEVLQRLVSDPATWATLQTRKGLLFVLVSGLLLYLLMRAQFHMIDASRKRARDLARRLKLLFSSIDDLVFVFDDDDRFIDSFQPNSAQAVLPRAEFIGRRIDEVDLPAHVRQLAVEAHARLRETGQAQTVEYSLELADGLRWFSSRISRISGPHGEHAGAISVIRDITTLKASEQRFRALFEETGNISVQGYDAERRVVFWNAASEALYGYTREEALGRRLEDLIIPAPMRQTVIALHQAWIQGGEHIPAGELDLLHKDGHLVPVFSSHALQRGITGEIEMYSVDIDLRVQREAQRQLRLAAQVFEGSGEGVVVTDHASRVQTINAAFTRSTGYTLPQLQDRAVDFLLTDGLDEQGVAGIWAVAREVGSWQGEVWSRRRNGERHAEWLTVRAVRDDQGVLTHFVAIFADIAEMRAVEAKLAHLAHHDALTGLPNRVLARDRVEQALTFAARENLRVGVLFLDLDNFKMINDTLGHAVGDRLLQAVSWRVSGCLRESDTVSRQGGDEFLVVLPGLQDADQVSLIAQKILDVMTPSFDIDGQSLACSFSIGVALYPDDGADFDSLLLKADTAMYHAKEAGRNAYRFFTEQMNADAHERLALQNHLRSALVRNEFELHYQPQIDLASGAIAGVEALLRWNSPELGPVSPARFIPVAEACGLIIPIGHWVLHEACRQTEAWRQQGVGPLRVAVNMSALQFRRSDPVALVSQVLAETRLPAACLELELTESLLVQDGGSTVLQTLRRLKDLGVRLAIDDFGTGYSSLAYLRRFPIDKLKIDQAFVHDIASDPDDAAIVKLIIELGRILKLSTIAEGVENAEQLAFLAEHGCNKGQGYLFARPMAADAFVEHFRAHVARPALLK